MMRMEERRMGYGCEAAHLLSSILIIRNGFLESSSVF